MAGKFKKLLQLYCADGVSGIAKAAGRSLISSVCDYQIQEVRGRTIADQDAAWSPPDSETELAIESSIIEPGGSLEPFSAEFTLQFRDSFDALKRRLDRGCTLSLARCARKDGAGKEIVAYSILERGGFSAAGIKGQISKSILFIHHTEVALEYRGRRIAQVLTAVMKEYCRSRGIKASVTAHTAGNTPSERAFRRVSGSRLLCHAVRVAFFRGLLVWRTPWKKIEKAIDSLIAEEAVRGSQFEIKKNVRGPGFEVRSSETKS
jgi:hypothetical protein